MSKLGDKTEVSMNIRTIIGIIMVIGSVAGTYFTLDAQVQSNKVEISRIKEYTDLNNEFRNSSNGDFGRNGSVQNKLRQ